MTGATLCPGCASTGARRFFRSPDLPVHIGVLHSTREDAVHCPVGPMVLAHCERCDLVFNAAFDPKLVEYSHRYDNSLFFSPTFQEYSRAVAERLVGTYGLRGKAVLEIGAGAGDFLRLVAELGENSGIGIDPASQPDSVSSDRIALRAEFFSERHLETAPDLVSSRYVLEHLPRPLDLLQTIRRGLPDESQTVLYFEVPDAFLILRALSIWDIIYEHCAYYTPLALANLFTRCGFDVLRVEETYGGQFIALDAAPADTSARLAEAPAVNTVDETQRLVLQFEREYRERVDAWRERTRLLAADRSRVALWGAGAKAVSLLNLLPLGDVVSYVVDINPAKHNCFVPGTGQPIVSPEHVRQAPPELVILTNPLYEREIQASLAALGVQPDLVMA